ncbi:SH2 domain-containing protein 4A isoform X1 [Mustela lutreola]|nr:SH2 domain-containing protein 4A isoform X1 [Mustela lutreola]XP_059012185.1 SH2 domain-containing protein 4A isoform X1 [Mustela lutreola]XP_059012186.1 SH2 domain-containing protein 4A isoform X1 [Mustela lutreola]XP_059012187.1 SH2 domain-containing protein 4A isoform X1 [Mustela lutreola]
MLKQILSEMYIDPDLLAELSEEQKQILFFKMREEQIRRWKEREAAMEKKESLPVTSRPKKENGKSVHWKLGADKEVWVWVMGEHHLDKPYDVLCNEIIAERAQLKAEREAEDLRKTQSKEFANNLKMKSQYYDLQAPDTQETQNICKKAATEEEKLGKGSRPAPLLEEEKIPCQHSGKTINSGTSQLCDASKIHNSSATQFLPLIIGHCVAHSLESLSSSSRNIQQMLADSINRMKAYGFHQKKEPEKKTQDEELKQIDEEKAKQIYKSWKEDSEWQASLRKSKAADEKRRSLAKQAREDYKRLSLAAEKGSGEGPQSPPGVLQKPKRPPLPPKPHFLNPAGYPPKPLRNQGVTRTASNSAQEDIIRWFKEEQLPLRAGYQTTSDTIAPWFHGILTLKRANELLSTREPGSFLVRVSERIKGYALSYLSEDGCKHFLIDASTDSYSFLGVDRLQHATLAALVDYHKVEPITSLGKELLLYPCGQQGEPPDYLELFE